MWHGGGSCMLGVNEWTVSWQIPIPGKWPQRLAGYLHLMHWGKKEK